MRETGWTPEYIDQMTLDELSFQCDQFVQLHNYLNQPPT